MSDVPLCVDLDGTLIRGDALVISALALVRKRPWMAAAFPFWLVGGRAALKRKIADRVEIDAAALSYNTGFVAWLREQKAAGRKLVLATASDYKLAVPIAAHVGIFDEVIGSDGLHNRKGAGKLEELERRYGREFDYAGNSSADIPIWRACRRAVVVNARAEVLAEAKRVSKVDRVFE